MSRPRKVGFWLTVRRCKTCHVVLRYYHTIPDFKRFWNGNHWVPQYAGLCQNCGDTEEYEVLAAWYGTWTWWKPWTWGSGVWQSREERLDELGMHAALRLVETRTEHK